MLSLQKARSHPAPNPAAHTNYGVQTEQQFSAQKYEEDSFFATFSAQPLSLAQMMFCCTAMSRIYTEAKYQPPSSALTLEMLRVIVEAKHAMETTLNDFLDSQEAGLPALSLEEAERFLRAEGDCYDKRGLYVANA